MEVGENSALSEADDAISDSVPEPGGHLLSWGCGEFGQHGHGGSGDDVGPDKAALSLEGLIGLYQGQGQANSLSKIPDTDLGTHHIRFVACGASHTAVVTDKDEVWTWGNGNSGQLGCGDKLTHASPQKLQIGPHDSRVAGVVCGSRHTVVWLENGRAFSCGNNFYAQLGYDFRIKNYKENQDSDFEQVWKERLIDQLTGREGSIEVLPHLLRPIMQRKVTQVACGEKFSLFLFDSGHVAGCGANNFGQLGNGTRAEVVSPNPLEDPEDVVSIACGSCHSLAVTASGELYVWGLGRACGSRRDDVLTPQRKTTRHSNVVGVAGGSSHSLALTANGTVYSWGGGADGQLGHGEDVMYVNQPRPLDDGVIQGRAVQVACGDSYSAALLGDGALYMWGKSSHVIPADQPSSLKVYQPTRIHFDKDRPRPVAMVTCGSWHAAAITGIPVRQPLEEDSEDSEVDVDEELTFDPMEAEENYEELDGSTDIWDMAEEVALPVSKDRVQLSSNHLPNRPRPPMRLAREGTRLTLEEFYSATPLPSVRPRDLRRASRSEEKASVAKQEPKLDNGELDVKEDVLLPSTNDDAMDETEADEAEAVPFQEPSVPEQRVEQGTPQTEFSSRKPYSLPPKTNYLSRSRTVDVIPKKKMISSSKSVPNVYDMTAMSGGGDAVSSGGTQGKFVIDKHIAIQSSSRKNSPNSSPSSSATSSRKSQDSSKLGSTVMGSPKIAVRGSPKHTVSGTGSPKQTFTGRGSPKQLVTTVSLMSSSNNNLPDVTEVKVTNSMPVPKMTRAHTLYGQMGSRGKGTDKPKGIPFSPPVVHSVAPLSSMTYKTPPAKDHG